MTVESEKTSKTNKIVMLLIKCIGFVLLIFSTFRINTFKTNKYLPLFFIAFIVLIVGLCFTFLYKRQIKLPESSELLKTEWVIFGLIIAVIAICISVYFMYKDRFKLANKVLYVGIIIYVIAEFHDSIFHIKHAFN